MTENLRVLVVDDMRTTRELLMYALRELGVENLEGASNGREALSVLGRGQTDLVISDLHMPDMDGIELYRQMKRTGGTDRTQFVLATGDETLGSLPDGYRLGGHRMLTKPYNPKALMECLAAAAQRAERSGAMAAQRLQG